ncbi:ImmA/IrrE family metallo-endopeptidase [uncultured Jatrophihabitans sp.]|uniref:ImmA/IrrE family metallo-endopeptidase n=1 Tax=uncultured Jatrophihabitans sp. TaxID=1610747 RepID=UPI0035CC0EB9
MIIAERQATQLLGLLDQTEPGVSLEWLTDGSLRNVDVVMTPRWRMESLSGMTTWRDGRWVIGINKGQPQARRRFTLGHELKHVVDAHRDKITYQNITPDQRERIADYFAACYLMPKMWLRRVWARGIQDPEALAGLFKVSEAAMRRRLTYLQYLNDEPDRATSTYFRMTTPPNLGDAAA